MRLEARQDDDERRWLGFNVFRCTCGLHEAALARHVLMMCFVGSCAHVYKLTDRYARPQVPGSEVTLMVVVVVSDRLAVVLGWYTRHTIGKGCYLHRAVCSSPVLLVVTLGHAQETRYHCKDTKQYTSTCIQPGTRREENRLLEKVVCMQRAIKPVPKKRVYLYMRNTLVYVSLSPDADAMFFQPHLPLRAVPSSQRSPTRL